MDNPLRTMKEKNYDKIKNLTFSGFFGFKRGQKKTKLLYELYQIKKKYQNKQIYKHNYRQVKNKRLLGKTKKLFFKGK